MKLSDLIGYKPELKTKPKEDDSTWDAIIDPFIAGTGRMAEDAAGTFFRLTRGNRDPEEYRNDPDVSSIRNLENWGREVRESHTHEYEPQTWQWYLNQAAESVPEMLGMMTVSTAAGTAVAPVVGTAGGIAAGALRSAPIIGRGVTSLGKAIQAYLRGNSAGSRVARAFTPHDARAFSSAEIGAGIEAELEAQGVYNQAIAAGMSVDDAERAAADARLKNFGIISLANAPAYNYLFGAPARQVLGMARPTQQGLLGRAGKFAGYNVLPESLEEGAQEIANQSALPFGYDPQAWLDSAIVGGLMGFGMGGAGAIGNRVINGAPPSYEEQLETWRRVNSAYSQNEANKYARKKYETQHGDEIRRQSQYDATKEQYARYRDWARDKTANQMSDEAFNLIVQAANKYGVPVDRALATAFAESEGNPDAISPAGAIGIMQLMPSTAADLGADPRNLEQNIDAGVRYLKQQYDATGDWTLAHAAYNAGLGNVQKAGGVPNFPETQNYVAKIDGFLRDVDNARYSSEDSPNAVYRGENGGGEGKYWVRNPNMNVSTEGMRPESLNALDMLGKYFFDHTGKRLILNAGTNGDHAEGEFSHANGWKFDIIDQLAGDGALFTADYGKGSFLDQFIQYGRSLGLGMNFEGEGTSNVHLDVAVDGTQWDGNGDNAGGFNPNVSTQSHADQLYNQRITEGVQREQEEIRNPKEPEKPLFDINAEDTTEQKLIEQFLTGKATTAADALDVPTLQFMQGVFDANGKFVATPENVQAAVDRYGDELTQFVQNNLSPTQEQPATNAPKSKTNPTQPSGQPQTPQDRNIAIASAGRKFLAELNQNPSNRELAFNLQTAINRGDIAAIEKILNDNGRTIQQPQPAQPTQPTQPTQSQQQPVTKNKTPQTLLPQPKLTPEFRASVSNAVTDFINRVTPDVNNNVALAPNDQNFYDSLLRITKQHGTDIASYDDKTIIDLAKGLKKIGVNIDVPQVDIAGANKQNLQQLQGLLPLQTRIQQALDTAEQQRKDAVKTKSKQAQEAYNAKKAKIVAPIQAQQQRKQEIEDEEQEYSDAFYPSSDQQSFLEDEDENQDWTIQRRQQEEQRRQQEEQQRQQEEKERREEDAFQKEVFGFRQAQNWLLNNGNEQAARDLEDAIQEKNLYKAHVIIERNKVPSEILNGESPKIQSPIQEKTNAIKNYSTQPTKDDDGSIDDGFVAISKAPIGTRIEITMDSSYPNPKEEFVVVQDSKTGGKALSSLKNYNYALSHKTNPITEPIDYQATSHLYKQFASNIKISYPEDATQKAKDIYDSFISRVRQEQNKQMEAGNVKTAQAMEDALQRKDFDKFKKLFTADEIKQVQGDPRQESLFGKNEKTPLINLIKQAREAAENGESIPLFSKRGSDVDTRIDNFVEDKDLTPLQKLLKSFGKMLGVKTVFFRNADARFHGAHSGNTTYINVNSEMPLSKVFWHESLHWLKANNPELYKQLVKAAGITDAQRQAYIKETGRTDLKTKEEIDEEILADQFEDAAKRTGLFQSIAGKNRGLIERVIQWLKDTMNKFIDHFRNPQGKLTTKQAQAFADEFGRIANQLKDPNGNKIFRYNRRTRNIELADGRKVEDFSFDEKATRENIARAEREGTIKYSVGNNNNSSESLWHKAKNAMSSFFSSPENRRRKRITDNLRRLSGHRILYGHIKGADAIVVDHLQKLIQSRKTYDWEKLLPVVGEEIAKNLNLNATQAQSNYIADWLITGALNNTTSPEAKAFEKAMRNNPAMAELLHDTRAIFKDIADMTPQERIASSMVSQRNKSFRQKYGLEGSFTEQVLDDLSPLQDLVEQAIKKSSPTVAAMIKRGVNVKQLAQMSRGSGAIANLMINGNPQELDNIRQVLAENFPTLYFDKFKTLTSIIESVDGDLKGLQTYAIAKLSKEIYEYNRAHPNDEPLIPYTSESDADAVIRDGAAKYGKAQEDLVRFSKILLAIRYESGLLTDNQYFNLMNSWKNYVPMARVFDENENYQKFDDLKRRQGHNDDTWEPIETMITNTHKVIQACERNKVKLELVTLVRQGGFDSNISEVGSRNPDADNIITFKENGVTKYLETPDPAIKRAVDAIQSKSDSSWLFKMLRAATSILRSFYTTSNLDFAAGNLLRDLPDAFIHNKQLGNTVPILDLVRAFGSAIKEMWGSTIFGGNTFSKDFIEWQMHGGAQASFVSQDVDYIQRSINEATMTLKQRHFKRGVSGFFSQVLDDFQKISEFTENITRLTSYKLAKNQLAKQHGGKADVTDKKLAALAAREASIDFSKAGISTRKLNRYVLFANAAVQSFNQWIEAGKEAAKGNKKPLYGKLFRAGVQGIILAGLQALWNYSDDDRKKEYVQAQEWEKETYWIFGGIRIPKGMDVGLRLIANLTDEAIKPFATEKPFEAKRLLNTIWTALPSLTATVITPAAEVELNKSYFRDAPIVPKSEQHLPSHMQYGYDTSPVAKWFGEMTGWSPRKIDYLISGYLGFMGRFASNPSLDWDKFPMIRRFVFTPYKNPKSVKEYYETYEKQEQLHNEYKLTKKIPEGFDRALYKRIKASYELMHKISKQEQSILNNPDLSYDERKAKIQELEKRRVAIAERALGQGR